jgi:hypothetical protein
VKNMNTFTIIMNFQTQNLKHTYFRNIFLNLTEKNKNGVGCGILG